MLDGYKPICKPAFLDSGAYSVKTGKLKELPVDEYMKFLNVYWKHFKVISIPDVIGDFDATERNTDYFIKHASANVMERATAIFHANCGNSNKLSRFFDQVEKNGIKTISIGSLVGHDRRHSITSLEVFYKKLNDRNLGVKTHIFGTGSPALVKMFKPDSMDSATFIHAGNGGQLMLYDGTAPVVDKSAGQRKFHSMDKLADECSSIVIEKGLLPDNLSSVPKKELHKVFSRLTAPSMFIIINGLALMKLESELKRVVHSGFDFYKTWWPFAQLHNPLAIDLCLSIWGVNSLIPFPKFYDLSGRRLEKALNIFGE